MGVGGVGEAMRIDSTGAATFSGTATAAGHHSLRQHHSICRHWASMMVQDTLIQNQPAGGPVMPLAFYTGGTEKAKIDASGNLLVGKTSDVNTANGITLRPDGGARFTSAGTGAFVQLAFFRNGAAGEVGSISTTSSATSYVTSSDQRLKENIADADDAGSKIDAIQVRKFDWKVDGSHQDYGMVAQELQALHHEAV